jgi:hypothetical protein
MVARQNLIVYQGADFKRVLEFKDGTGELIDLEGYSFRAQARSSFGAELAFSFEFTVRDQSAQKGMVDMNLPAAASEVLAINKESDYFYDVEMVANDGEVRRIMEGKIRVFPEVTR